MSTRMCVSPHRRSGAVWCSTIVAPAVSRVVCILRRPGLQRWITSLRKPEQQTFLGLLSAAPEQERQRTVFELAPGQASHACIVSTFLVGERSSAVASTTPRRIAADEVADRSVRDLARMLGSGDGARTGVTPAPFARARAEWSGPMACWRPASRARRGPGVRLHFRGGPAPALWGDRWCHRLMVRRCHHRCGSAYPCAAAGRGVALADGPASWPQRGRFRQNGGRHQLRTPGRLPSEPGVDAHS